MIRHADEIPISYLNKGQAYSLSIVDTSPTISGASPALYRTFVRVSFQDKAQRSRPGPCWQLWKEGRGTTEAHQRDGKLLAVEYVDTNQGGDDDSRKQQVRLESNSFDGFCVTWGVNPRTGRAECSTSVRFNFLSTDFSHSKGVKGIPVRLCAKTERVSPGFADSGAPDSQPEVCFAKVKLFRDHGAERKLANDVAHVKKTIDKLQQQISEVESGLSASGKRKRSAPLMVKSCGKGPGKIAKHKRTWSMGSDGDAAAQSTTEEALVMKLTRLQDMFTSTRPVSVLYLRGEAEDDPDQHPVTLPVGGISGLASALTRHDTWDSKTSAASTPTTSNALSPTSSSNVVLSPLVAQGSMKPPLCISTAISHGGSHSVSPALAPTSQSSVHPGTIAKTGISGDAIKVLGVDVRYQAPPERILRPGKNSFIFIYGANTHIVIPGC
jgi:hypothetical protein